jgi:hypothetical protein
MTERPTDADRTLAQRLAEDLDRAHRALEALRMKYGSETSGPGFDLRQATTQTMLARTNLAQWLDRTRPRPKPRLVHDNPRFTD